MKNRFYDKPNESIIKEIGDFFCLQDALISIDYSDIKECLDDADNAVVLTGKSTGLNRCADAIEDAVLHTCSVANEYDLFSANNVILYILSPKEKPMLMNEAEAISTFVQMFKPNTVLKWGFAEICNQDEMKVIIIASNLVKK